MKKLLLTLLIFFTLSCGVIKEQPSWTNIGTKNIVTEVCRDTVDVQGLARNCKTHNLHPSMDEWTLMTYYSIVDDVLTDTMNQYVYTCGSDTTYVITKHDDDKYIFVMRVNKPIE